MRGLGFFLFARHYLGNTYLSLLLLVLRCFTSQGALSYHKDKNCEGLLHRVSPFGNLRIKGCYTPPRSLSQLRHVLHRLLKSRHPPYALKFPVKKFENHSRRQNEFVSGPPTLRRGIKLKKILPPDRSGLKYFWKLFPVSSKDPERTPCAPESRNRV